MNDRMRLKKLCVEIDAAYVVIRRCAHEAAKIIYDNPEKVGELMDDLAQYDAEGGGLQGSNAESCLLFTYDQIQAVTKIKTILRAAEMDWGVLESYLKED